MATKTLLDKAAILAASDIKTVDVDVSEWGGTVRLRAFSLEERMAFLAEVVERDGKTRRDSNERLLVACLVDEEGVPLFTKAEFADLGKKSWAVLERLITAAMTLNGLGDQAVEEVEKNLEIEPSGVSHSGSRSLSDAPLQNSDAG